MQKLANTKSPYRSVGLSALASGLIGILSIGTLIAYMATRSPDPETGILMNRMHDGGVILQFLFMIPVVFGLQKVSQQQGHGLSQGGVYTGIGAIVGVIFCLILIFPKIVSDILYMVPQGIFGAWLIFVHVRMKKTLSKGLRWFGIIIGLGLVLVGIFALGFAIFVDISPLQIPAAPSRDFPQTFANNILHQILFAGTILGVLTFPIWTILMGLRFFRQKGND